MNAVRDRPRASSSRSPTGKSSPPTRLLSAKEAIFGELATAASVAGLLKSCAAGRIPAGSRVVCSITGNGLKDPDWALSGAPSPATIAADPGSAASALGLA